MSFAKKFNTVKPSFDFKASDDAEYIKPSKLVQLNGLDEVYTLRACYVNKKGLYGAEPVLINDTHLVNAPKHFAETVENILKDENAIKLINLGKVGFKFYEYENRYGTQYGVQWVDL